MKLLKLDDLLLNLVVVFEARRIKGPRANWTLKYQTFTVAPARLET